jgi:hypothetical protein
VYTIIYDELTVKGLKTKFQKCKAPTALKHFLHSKGIPLQLVPPYFHRQNTTERSMQILKKHFITALCSTDKQFPIHFWDRPVPHAIITPNLLRQSCLNSKLSAHAQLNGPFDYNATPLAAPGTRVIIHEIPDQQGSWSPHGLNGWYIGPIMEHYQAHRVYFSTTGQKRISDTVEFFPHHCKVLVMSSTDAAAITALDLTLALQNLTQTSPFKQLGTERMQAIKKLAAMLPEKATMEAHTDPTPRVPPQPTPRNQTSRVPSTRVKEDTTPNPEMTEHDQFQPRCSPRSHMPPHVTQEERAYQLPATPLPRINRA